MPAGVGDLRALPGSVVPYLAEALLKIAGRSPSRRPGGPARKRCQHRPPRPPVTTQGSPVQPTAPTGGDLIASRFFLRRHRTAHQGTTPYFGCQHTLGRGTPWNKPVGPELTATHGASAFGGFPVMPDCGTYCGFGRNAGSRTSLVSTRHWSNSVARARSASTGKIRIRGFERSLTGKTAN